MGAEMINIERTRKFVDQCWGDDIVPTLVEYIRIPNKSPAFDPDWAAHGYMDEAVLLFERWARGRLADLPGAKLEVVRLPGRTPVIVFDLPHYVDHLAERLGNPSLVICLDSGCGNYDQLWLTTSLRGLASGTLTVKVLEEGVHSGDASGVVPSSFRVLCLLLSRIEDEEKGAIRPSELYVQIPPERVTQARRAAAALGSAVYTKFPFPAGTSPVTEDLTELVLNRSWRPQLAVTGVEGLPKPADAGNVLLPYTPAKLSLRLPPTLDAAAAGAALRALLEKSPPYGAGVKFEVESSAAGWNAPALSPWLENSLARGSQLAFGAPPAYMGEGGSIPFMAMLGEKFPQAQFVVTGVLGPHSNAHGPNEFLHLPTARRVSLVIAQVLADHAAHSEAA